MSALLTVLNVSKSFGVRRILDDVSFSVDEGDRIGLIGVNGSGKSTLLRLVAKEDENWGIDSGTVSRQRGLTLEYVPQEPELDRARTVTEVLSTGLRLLPGEEPGTRQHEVLTMADRLGLTRLSQRVGEISIGEYRRVALGRALLAAPAVLALDEPTNHLDADTVEWLESALAAHRGALLLVTHDRYFLDRVANRIFELDRGHLYAYSGGYEAFLEKQAERLANAAERERVRRAFVRNELDWIRRGPKARTTKQQARIDRFDDAVSAGETAKSLTPDERAMTLRLPTGPRLGKTILETRGLEKRAGDRVLFKDLTLTLKAGDRIGIIGPNGVGKTTLIRTLLGLLTPDAGEVTVGQNTKFAYLDQGRADLDDTHTVLEEVAGGHDHVLLEEGPVHVRTFLRMMLFDDSVAQQPIGKLSGGERNRVQLTKLLRLGGNVLVLDEPTNDLDLITLGILENALTQFPGCALVVSHDRWFLDRVATAILAFEGGGKLGYYEGNYSLYREKHASAAIAVAPAPKETEKKPAAPTRTSTPRPRKLSFNEKRELDGMEAAIEAAETKVKTLEETLNAPELYVTRAADAPRIVSELEAARAEVERLFNRWQELEALRSQEP